jgi:methionyl-tRNA formyltransferase
MSTQSPPLLLLSGRPWNAGLAGRLGSKLDRTIHVFTRSRELNLEAVQAIDPRWIFVPHWSDMIPEEIWSRWPTVIFHMTDLPYGRGGSPLQNLIQAGHSSTMVTALRCTAEIDAGPIYCKVQLNLQGSAEEIFLQADNLIEGMILHIVQEEPEPQPQQVEPIVFRRRKPEQSNLGSCPPGNLIACYDMIRMLDAESYPHAYIVTNGLCFEFRRVSRRSDGLHADVKITSMNGNQQPWRRMKGAEEAKLE